MHDRRLVVGLLGFGLIFALGYAADTPKATESVQPTFDVRAERARRDALKRAQQQEEVDRMKRAGEPFLTKYVDPKFPTGIAKNTYLVQIPVRIHVDEAGIVRGINIESPSNPPFDWAVIEAVWQWRFSPKKDFGKAVPFDMLTTVAVARSSEKGANPSTASSTTSASPAAQATPRP